MTRFKRLAQFLAKALEYKYRFPLSPDYPSDDSLFGGRRSWIKTEREPGIIPLARQVFKEYGRYYSDDNVFVTKFVLGRQRRDPLIERLLATETPTEEQTLNQTATEPTQPQPVQPTPQVVPPTPQVVLPSIPQAAQTTSQVVAEKAAQPQPVEATAESQAEQTVGVAPITPAVSRIPRRFPQIPPNIVNLGKIAASNAGIFLKKNVTRYLTFGNLITSIFTALGGIAGAILGKGSALATVAGAGAGGIGSTWVRSAEGRRSLLNLGSGAISRTVNFSSQFSTQSLFKGPPKKVLIGFLVGFFALTALGAGFLPTQEQQPTPPAAAISGDKFLGVNIHSLTGKDPAQISHILDNLKKYCGTSMIRLFYASEPTEDLQKTLDLGSKYGVRFIVSLADFANRSEFSDLIPLELTDNPTGWYRDGYKTAYKAHVEKIVTTFQDHPAIYAWELANEPHCAGFADCVEAYTAWVKDMSDFIYGIDRNHLISVGTQANAEFQLGDSVNDGQYEKINSFSSVTALSGHYYDGSPEAIKHGADTFQSQKDLMLKEIAIAKTLNKPFYIGEAGFLCQENQIKCTEATNEAKNLRAELLKNELSDIFNAGATGYLIWQYSDRITDLIENDPFSFFEGDPICSVLNEFSQKTISPPISGDLNSCQFVRGDRRPPAESYQSPTLLSYFQEAERITSVPAVVLAAIARVESPSVTSKTDADLPYLSSIKGCPRSITGALGIMQLQPPGTRGYFAPGIELGAIFLGKNVGSLTENDFCNLRSNIIMAGGFILKKLQLGFGIGNGTKWNSSWTNDKNVIYSVAEGYYGCLEYGGLDPLKCEGSYNYGDDIWTSIQSCQVTQ